MFYTHNPVDSELFMMANEGCGGQFGIQRCLCGAYAQFFLQNNRHLAMGTSSPNPDGSGYEASFACTQCALSWVDTACFEKTDDPCMMNCAITREIKFDGETVWKLSLNTLEERHPYAESAKLAEGATSCEDGVIVTYTCTECGDTYTNEIDWHYRFVLETMDFNAIEGACGGILVQEGCACGAERGLDWNDRFACCWTTSTKTHTDESGKEITVYTNICEECGLTWTETCSYEDTDDPCWKQRFAHVAYTMNGEYLGEVNSNNERSAFHQLKREFSFADGATSCKDGVTVTTTCAKCDGVWKDTYDDHQYFEVESVDLWRELKACGGYLVSEACPCGEFSRLYWRERPCQFEMAEDGNSLVCTECGLTVVETDTTRTGKNACEIIHQHKITVSMGEDSYSMSQEWIETDHRFGGKWDGEIESCVNSGVTVALSCIRCGASGGEITLNNHVSLLVYYLDFGAVGGCGGEFCVYRCPCGEVSDRGYWNVKCEFGWVESDQNNGKGHEACVVCGLVRTEVVSTEKIPGTCDIVDYGTVTLQRGDSKKSVTYESYGTEHQLVYTRGDTVSADACKNGLAITMSCVNCAYSEQHFLGKDHQMIMTYYLDVQKIGGCGSVFVVDSCPCGKESQAYWWKNLCQFTYTTDAETGTKIGTCTNCKTTVMELQTVKESEKNPCEVTYYNSISLRNGEDALTATYTRTVIAHQFIGQWGQGITSCKNGVTVTLVCQRCKQPGEVKTIYTHETFPVVCLDFAKVGACGGEFRVYRCPCGESSHQTLERLQCRLQVDYDASTGDEYQICTKCQMTLKRAKTTQKIENSCQVKHTNTATIQLGEDSLSQEWVLTDAEHTWSVTWGDNIESCEDGVEITRTCTRCGYVSTETITNHECFNVIYDLSKYGACGGTLSVETCPCGSECYVSKELTCDTTYSYHTYVDQKGKTIEVKKWSCATCGLIYDESTYEDQKQGSCFGTMYSTIVVCVKETDVDTFHEARSFGRHSEELHSYELVEGAKTCEDGVHIVEKCAGCGVTFESTVFFHRVFETETTIDLGTCGGYAVECACACGQKRRIELNQHANCDFGMQDTELWIENAISGLQSGTDGENQSRRSYAQLYTCAVTEPLCAYSVRYASYWLPVEGETCVIARYETWQFGYDAKTNTFAQEIVIATGERALWHTYVENPVSEKWESTGTVKVEGTMYTCSVCQSTYSSLDYYNENRVPVKKVKTAINTLTNEFNKQYHYEREYVQDHLLPKQEVITYADGSTRTTEYAYDGCTQTQVTTERDGTKNTWTREHCVFTWTFETEPTCTQPGKEICICAICGEKLDKAEERDPEGHDWGDESAEGGVYTCSRCGLENTNGADGAMVVEDLSDDQSYVVGYWNKGDVTFTKYVSIVQADNEVILAGINLTDLTAPRAIAFSKAEVEAAATEKGYESGTYDVRFTFSTGDLDYAITFTNKVTDDPSAVA